MFRCSFYFASAVAAAACCVTCLPAAQAHRRDFPVTYDWIQPAKGAYEIESKTTYSNADKSLGQEVELEIGVTDRLMVAPYLVFTKDDTGGLHFSGYKVESRYQLGTFKYGQILTGLYAEFEKPKGEPGEGEGKLILSRYGENGSDLSINLVTEKTLEHSDNPRTAYSFGYAVPLGRGRAGLRGGAEVYKSIDNGQVNGGPTLGFSPTENTWLVGGIGLPINRIQGNAAQFRLLAEYEW